MSGKTSATIVTRQHRSLKIRETDSEASRVGIEMLASENGSKRTVAQWCNASTGGDAERHATKQFVFQTAKRATNRPGGGGGGGGGGEKSFLRGW
ncbi:hypothetical protein M0802_008093 [Mischocyttarus mexicanus]|nr:hypothetical protein M0802_008093 [Mischocyttarus mexicanus]